MKTKLYVGIALITFIVCLLVIYSAGFTQNYLMKKEANQQLLLDRQNNSTLIVSDNSTATPVQTNTNQPSTQNTTKTTSTGTTGTTTPVTTPVVSKPTPRYRPPVTRAS